MVRPMTAFLLEEELPPKDEWLQPPSVFGQDIEFIANEMLFWLRSSALLHLWYCQNQTCFDFYVEPATPAIFDKPRLVCEMAVSPGTYPAVDLLYQKSSNSPRVAETGYFVALLPRSDGKLDLYFLENPEVAVVHPKGNPVRHSVETIDPLCNMTAREKLTKLWQARLSNKTGHIPGIVEILDEIRT